MMKDGVLKFVEGPRDDGGPLRVFHFEDFTIEPFGFEDLTNATPGKSLTAMVRLRNARLGALSENVEITDERYSSDFILESHYSSKSYGLTEGGWFPPGITTKREPTYLLDRCTYNDIRPLHGLDAADVPREDFIEYLRKPKTKINLLPILLEGNQGRKPTDEEVSNQYREVEQNVLNALPEAELRPLGEEAIQAVRNLLQDPFLDTRAEQKFLLDVASILESPIGGKRKPEVLRRVREAAKEHGVGTFSFAFLSAVSAVVCEQSKSPGREVLKFKRGYSQRDVYNSLADLSSLKILSSLIAIFPHETPVFYTSDKALALFWVGLGMSDFRFSSESLSMNFEISDRLFPGIDTSFFQQNRWR